MGQKCEPARSGLRKADARGTCPSLFDRKHRSTSIRARGVRGESSLRALAIFTQARTPNRFHDAIPVEITFPQHARVGHGAAPEHPLVARQLLTAEYGILNSVRAVHERNMMINASTDPNQNQLLAALPHDQRQRSLPHLEHVEMPLGQVLYEPGSTLSHVYFPTTAIVSLLLRYTQALITQMVQTAACNRHHSLDQQLCRWLLLSLDHLQGTEMVMTQELIANMLGVPREGATEGALKLQNAGLIDYTRGRIPVLDRAALEKRTCECYAVVKKEYDRLLPDKLAA